MLIDLKEVKSLCSVSMYFRPTYGPQALSVSVSIDKQLWFPTGGYRANNCNDTMKSRLNYDFARNIATRYIRLDFSNGCKPAIVLTEIQVFGTALNPVRWIRASQQHNNRSAVKQHPCDIQTQCVRRVWDENVHNIGKVVTIEISFNTSCNRLHSIAVGIANYSNHSSYIDEFFQSHVHSVVRETSFSLPRLYNILHYDLNASINMERGIFELSMQYGTEIFRTAPLFVLLGGGFYNSTGMNSIKPPLFSTEILPVQRNCGCQVAVVGAKSECTANNTDSGHTLRVQWNSNCDYKMATQIVVYVLNESASVKSFIDFMRLSKNENLMSYSQTNSTSAAMKNLQKNFVVTMYKVPIQNATHPISYTKEGNLHSMTYSLPEVFSSLPIVIDVQTVSKIVFNHRFNTYVPMSSFYVSANTLEEGHDDDNHYYGNHLSSIVDIACAEKCFVNVTKLEYSCATELSRTVLNLHFDTNCNSVDDIEIYHVDSPDLADMIRLELLNDMKTTALSNLSKRSYSNFLVYQKHLCSLGKYRNYHDEKPYSRNCHTHLTFMECFYIFGWCKCFDVYATLAE